jgi:hypothetical protein
MRCAPENRLEKLERELKQKLGRDLTPREKFYLAMSAVCTADVSGHPAAGTTRSSLISSATRTLDEA